MPSAFGNIAGAVVGGLLGGGGSGGTQTQSKEPWAAATPWLYSLLNQGQQLNNKYIDNPFSDAQKQAYANMADTNSYIRSAVPGLLGTINQQQPFDRTNPLSRPAQFQFSGMTPSSTSLPGATAGNSSTVSAMFPATTQSAPQVASQSGLSSQDRALLDQLMREQNARMILSQQG